MTYQITVYYTNKLGSWLEDMEVIGVSKTAALDTSKRIIETRGNKFFGAEIRT